MIPSEREEQKELEQGKHLPDIQHRYTGFAHLFTGTNTALYNAERASFHKSRES